MDLERIPNHARRLLRRRSSGEQTITSEIITPPVKKIDVIGQKDRILPAIEELVRINMELGTKYYESKREYADLVQAAREKVIDPVWGSLKSGGKNHNLLSEANSYHGFDVELEGHNVLSPSRDTEITRCVVLGWNPLSSAIRPIIRDSFVLGHNAISGSGTFRDLTPEQIVAFAQAAKGHINGDRGQYLEGLTAFDSLVPEDQRECTNRWFRDTRPDIHARFIQYRKLDVAAYEVDNRLHRLKFFGGTYRVDMDNSVVFGHNALNSILGRIIRNSIIGGYSPLSGAHVRIQNSYVVNHRGIQYFEDAYIGNPDLSEFTLPLRNAEERSLEDRGRHSLPSGK